VIALLTALDAHQKTILVVEDYEDTRDFLDVLIKTETSYRVLSIADGDETLERVEELTAIQPVLFIFDFQLPAMTALHLYDRLQGFREFILFQQADSAIVSLQSGVHIDILSFFLA